MRWAKLALCAVAFAACGGGTSTDAGATDAGPDTSASGDAGADAPASCTTDADSDGHRSMACGGDDCDDSDPNRYPGNTEICDAANHDEDCDPRTFGVRDLDRDGYPDVLCCNVAPSGAMTCGTDCNDSLPDVHPTAPEVCNGMDDDCNGLTDDVSTPLFLDCDGDAFGDPMHTMVGCPHPAASGDCMSPASGAAWIATGGDCDDAHASVHPGATEVCNAVDDDCNTLVDDVAGGGCSCTPPMTRDCGVMVGACHVGTQSCIAGRWETACGGAYVGPTSESCNGVDDDCNGVVDDGVGTAYYVDADGDTYGAGAAVISCTPIFGSATRGGDCDDADPTSHPGGEQRCSTTQDGDCDGVVGYNDPDSDTWCTTRPGIELGPTPHCGRPPGDAAADVGTCVHVYCTQFWFPMPTANCNSTIIDEDGCETALATEANCSDCGLFCMSTGLGGYDCNMGGGCGSWWPGSHCYTDGSRYAGVCR